MYKDRIKMSGGGGLKEINILPTPLSKSLGTGIR